MLVINWLYHQHYCNIGSSAPNTCRTVHQNLILRVFTNFQTPLNQVLQWLLSIFRNCFLVLPVTEEQVLNMSLSLTIRNRQNSLCYTTGELFLMVFWDDDVVNLAIFRGLNILLPIGQTLVTGITLLLAQHNHEFNILVPDHLKEIGDRGWFWCLRRDKNFTVVFDVRVYKTGWCVSFKLFFIAVDIKYGVVVLRFSFSIRRSREHNSRVFVR